jgi:hypothetical protein
LIDLRFHHKRVAIEGRPAAFVHALAPPLKNPR